MTVGVDRKAQAMKGKLSKNEAAQGKNQKHKEISRLLSLLRMRPRTLRHSCRD